MKKNIFKLVIAFLFVIVQTEHLLAETYEGIPTFSEIEDIFMDSAPVSANEFGEFSWDNVDDSKMSCDLYRSAKKSELGDIDLTENLWRTGFVFSGKNQAVRFYAIGFSSSGSGWNYTESSTLKKIATFTPNDMGEFSDDSLLDYNFWLHFGIVEFRQIRKITTKANLLKNGGKYIIELRSIPRDLGMSIRNTWSRLNNFRKYKYDIPSYPQGFIKSASPNYLVCYPKK